jgi:hypothetical protein
MATQFPQQLAQLIAQNRPNFQVQQPQVQSLPSLVQGGAPGQLDPLGAAFGKGIGTALQDTIGATEKQKWLQENDPLEIEKRAVEFVEAYNKLDDTSQAQVLKQAMSDPKGYSKLARFAKSRPELFDKVADPIPGQPDKYYPRKFALNKADIEARDLARMPQTDRIADMRAVPNLQRAQTVESGATAALRGAQTTDIPLNRQAENRKVVADEMTAEANQTKAGADMAQVNQAGRMEDVNKREKEAHIKTLEAQARAADRRDPELAKLTIQLEREKNALRVDKEKDRRSIVGKYMESRQSIEKSVGDLEMKLPQFVSNATSTARLLKGNDPGDPAGTQLLLSATDLLTRAALNPKTGGIAGTADEYSIIKPWTYFKTPKWVINPQNLGLAKEILSSMGSPEDAQSVKDLQDHLEIFRKITGTFWPSLPDLVPGIGSPKTPEEAQKLIDGIVKKVMKDESLRLMLRIQQQKGDK